MRSMKRLRTIKTDTNLDGQGIEFAGGNGKLGRLGLIGFLGGNLGRGERSGESGRARRE